MVVRVEHQSLKMGDGPVRLHSSVRQGFIFLILYTAELCSIVVYGVCLFSLRGILIMVQTPVCVTPEVHQQNSTERIEQYIHLSKTCTRLQTLKHNCICCIHLGTCISLQSALRTTKNIIASCPLIRPCCIIGLLLQSASFIDLQSSVHTQSFHAE